MSKEEDEAWPTLYVGLTELLLGDTHIDLGHGIFLRGAEATFQSSLLLVNTDEASKRPKPGPDVDGLPPLPRPSVWQFSNRPTLITAEIAVPSAARSRFSQQFALARFIGSLLRLWCNPAIRMHAMAKQPFTELIRLEVESPRVVPLESFRQNSRLGLFEAPYTPDALAWIQKNWNAALHLYATSAEFRLAADALDAAQFIESEALALVSLWAAMEGLFSPSNTELKFRVSALIASYLEAPGQARRARQKAIAILYDKRSAAAHGKPKHQSADLLATFELLRRILIQMIHQRAVPTKEELEARLFGE